MRDVVRSAFYDFSARYEGAIPWLYQDVLGLVSIGVGILADPLSLCVGLPLVRPDGEPATKSEIAAEWQRIKTLPPNARGQTAAQLGHVYAHAHAVLRLTPEGLRSTLAIKMQLNDNLIRKTFPDFEDWPADAQLATHSMAWACGAACWPKWPKLSAALREEDFTTAAVECFMPAQDHGNPGLRPRNIANRMLYRNAARVNLDGMDPDVLYFPRDLASDEETKPALVPPVSRSIQAKGFADFPIVHRLPGSEEPPDDAA
jgi:hypothetical protein